MKPATAPPLATRFTRAFRLGDMPVALATIIVGTPLIATLLIGVFAGGGETWTHISETFLWAYILNTLAIMALMALLMLAIAVPAAWLVTMYQFPGCAFFSWLLICRPFGRCRAHSIWPAHTDKTLCKRLLVPRCPQPARMRFCLIHRALPLCLPWRTRSL